MFLAPAVGRFRKFGRVFACLAAPAILAGVMPAERHRDVDFAEVIKTPLAIQAALERCDGDPAFETAFANWLESAQPRSPSERDAIRKTSLRLLEDTTDRQLVLGLIDGLLRHAVDDVKSDPAIVPARMARTLYAGIARAVKNRKSRASDVALLAESLLKDGAVTNERQASFVQEVVNLAALRTRQPVEPARSSSAEITTQ